MKKCSICKEEKELIEFGKDSRLSDGLKSACKDCRKKESEAYHKTKNGIISQIYSGQKRTSKKRKHRKPSYSKNELKDWMMSEPIFHKLFKEWEDSGYYSGLKPSIDRTNDYVPYMFSNIEITTWDKNRDKLMFDIANNKNNKTKKAVSKLSMSDNSVIENFSSAKEAQRKTGIFATSITQCCKEKLPHAGGFKWEYKKTDREIALELEIAGLKDQLKAAGSVVMGSSSKPRKIPVTLSEAQELIVVDYYLANKDEKIKIKDIAAKYNISDNKVSDILYKAGVRIPGKRNRKVTYAE